MKKSLVVLFVMCLLGIVGTVIAVPVKHRENRDLTTYECHETKSSFVHILCYKADSTLTKLNTTWYEYCNLPRAIFDAWLSAPSKGKYYNKNVKYTDQYRCSNTVPMNSGISRGCCSYHRGMCSCLMGQVQCCDGWINSSCRC